jgi:glycosyltransferase involved in cell wall biosynthesis
MKKLFLILTISFNLLSSEGFTKHFLTYIIPCYNCEKWVEESIVSIYNQKLNCPFEVICTDDSSSDKTYDLLLKLAKEHPEMKVYKHSINLGGGSARNTCVAHSRGDIIFCLDSDNVLVKNSIQKLIDHMDKTGHDVVSFGSLKYFSNKPGNKNLSEKIVAGNLVYHTKRKYYRLKDVFKSSDSPIWSGNYLYTRKSYNKAGGYPVNLGAIDTFSFGFLQLLHGSTLSYVPNTFYWHRHGIDSYYVRDGKDQSINTNFFNFLLKHRRIFRKKSVVLMEEIMEDFKKTGTFSNDLIWFLDNKKIRLKKRLF